MGVAQDPAQLHVALQAPAQVVVAGDAEAVAIDKDGHLGAVLVGAQAQTLTIGPGRRALGGTVGVARQVGLDGRLGEDRVLDRLVGLLAEEGGILGAPAHEAPVQVVAVALTDLEHLGVEVAPAHALGVVTDDDLAEVTAAALDQDVDPAVADGLSVAGEATVAVGGVGDHLDERPNHVPAHGEGRVLDRAAGAVGHGAALGKVLGGEGREGGESGRSDVCDHGRMAPPRRWTRRSLAS